VAAVEEIGGESDYEQDEEALLGDHGQSGPRRGMKISQFVLVRFYGAVAGAIES
jgi:hypothetical protein